MTEQLDDHDDLAAGIFGDIKYLPTQTEPKEFKPWHKPRKQFVRREQLSTLLLRLFERRETEDPLRYLGLPGTDLIDLRYLYEQLCHTKGRPLSFLGFNTEAQPGNPAHVQLGVSLHEVRRLPNVDTQSDVIHDDFRRLGNLDSNAWSRTRKLGPFDVVNIDLCDGLASDPPQNDESVYKALDQLMAFQARNSNPWLLLIATRIGRGMFDVNAEQQLIRHFRQNVDMCEGFAEECDQLLESDVEAIDPATCSDSDFLHLMTVAIGKWLAALVKAHARNRVELASVQAYRINPDADHEDLVSLAFRVTPIMAASKDALSPSPPIQEDECKTAQAILRRSAKRVDVDSILEQQWEVRHELIGETKRLLADARYDVTGYPAWAES